LKEGFELESKSKCQRERAQSIWEQQVTKDITQRESKKMGRKLGYEGPVGRQK
jgi:hypothetical protein